MNPFRRFPLSAVVLACSIAEPAFADTAPVVVPGTINMFRDDRGDNDVGVTPGDRFQFGADIAGGSAAVSILGTAATGFTTTVSPCNPLDIDPDFCAKSSAYNSGRLDPWTISFSVGSKVTTVTAPSMVGVPSVPFPTSVTMSGHGLTPTIAWVVPGGVTPDGFRVQVWNKSVRLANGQADVIYSKDLVASATSFTLPSSVGLSTRGNYAINFELIETRDGKPFLPGSNNANIFSRSDSYFDFTPLTGSAPTDVALPTIDGKGVYHFEVGDVGADHVTFIDPAVATGYIYAIGAGGPDFQSVILPDEGDGQYTLTYVDASGTHTVTVTHDQQYFFGSGGVAGFTVTGIEPSAGVDPTNGTAFVTGLTFASAGDFIGTMTPITTNVAGVVPEPSMSLLLLAGLGIAVPAAARRRRHAPERLQPLNSLCTSSAVVDALNCTSGAPGRRPRCAG